MATRIIEQQTYINPATRRRLTNVRRIRKMIMDGVFQVPNGLIINDNNRLVLDNERNKKGENYVNGRKVGVFRENFNSEAYNVNNFRYTQYVIQNSGMKGNILVKYYFNDKKKEPVQHSYNVPDAGSLSTWWDKETHYNDWKTDSDHFIFDYYELRQNSEGEMEKFYIFGRYFDGYFVVSQITDLNPINVVQNFRDGVSNCLLTPVKKYFTELLERTEKKNKRDEINKKIRQINEFMDTFKDGVPEENINNITKVLSIAIRINDIKNNTMINSRSDNCRIFKTFEYINNKLDHVELNYINDAIKVNKKEFRKLLNELGEGDYYTNSKIFKKDQTYILEDPVYEKQREWEQSQKLDNIDYKINPLQSDFIFSSCHYGGAINFTNDPFENLGSVKQIDHVKSYYNYKSCKYYDTYKMPCAPSVYRKIPEDFPFQDFTGFWKIKDIDWNFLSENSKLYLKKLNIYNVASTFTTPELLFMRDIGLKFKLEYGAWNCKTQDIDMEPLLNIDVRCQDCINDNKKCCDECKDNIKPYKIWSGKQASIKLDNVICLKGSKKMGQFLASKYPDRVRYNEYNNTIFLATEKKVVYHRAHITSYILSYSRISVLSQLFSMPFEKIRRICLDGIFYVDLDIPVPENFKEKPIDKITTCDMDTYYSSYPQKEWNFPYYEEWNKHPIIYGFGAGGSGKTHYFLTNSNLTNPCYVACENKIIAEKRQEYNIKNTCTVQKLLVDSYNPADTKILLIDECSKLCDKVLKKIINKYDKSLIILCGDICQLPPFGEKPEDKQKGDYSKFFKLEFTTNYRCKCPELLSILNYLRELILEGKVGNKFIIDYLKERLKNNKGNLENYQVDEYIITGPHRKINEITERLDKKGLPKKWLIKSTTESNYTGDIVISEKKPNSSVLRHAFTAHAMQGITIKAPNKLYVDIDGMFCLEMAYTTLSRCEYLNQIILV